MLSNYCFGTNGKSQSGSSIPKPAVVYERLEQPTGHHPSTQRPRVAQHAGKIIHDAAMQKSSQEFEKFKLTQQPQEKEQSSKEIEEDIKLLGKDKKD